MIRAAVFDFDGVIVESADIKTDAFIRLFAEHEGHGEEIAAYLVANQGLSRYLKFQFIYEEILDIPLSASDRDRLSVEFSRLVLDAILRCPFVPGARELLERRHASMPLFIASATPEQELHGIVRERELERFFEGVHGTPETKAEILARLCRERGLRAEEVVFVGDQPSDVEGARIAGVPFIGRLAHAQSNPFPEEVRIVTDLAELDRDWDRLLVAASPPSRVTS